MPDVYRFILCLCLYGCICVNQPLCELALCSVRSIFGQCPVLVPGSLASLWSQRKLPEMTRLIWEHDAPLRSPFSILELFKCIQLAKFGTIWVYYIWFYIYIYTFTINTSINKLYNFGVDSAFKSSKPFVWRPNCGCWPNLAAKDVGSTESRSITCLLLSASTGYDSHKIITS